MKTRHIVPALAAITVAAVLAGCGPMKAGTTTPAPAGTTTTVAKPRAAVDASTLLSLTDIETAVGQQGLRYDVSSPFQHPVFGSAGIDADWRANPGTGSIFEVNVNVWPDPSSDDLWNQAKAQTASRGFTIEDAAQVGAGAYFSSGPVQSINPLQPMYAASLDFRAGGYALDVTIIQTSPADQKDHLTALATLVTQKVADV